MTTSDASPNLVKESTTLPRPHQPPGALKRRPDLARLLGDQLQVAHEANHFAFHGLLLLGQSLKFRLKYQLIAYLEKRRRRLNR